MKALRKSLVMLYRNYKEFGSRFLLNILLVFAANDHNQRMAPASGLRPRLPPSPCTPISSSQRFKDEGEWVGGRRRTGEEDESGVEISLAEHLCFHPSPPHHPSSPHPKKHSFPSSSSRSPPNPSLLNCICFLIRSVWEAHEPSPPPPTPPHPTLHSPFSWWL